MADDGKPGAPGHRKAKQKVPTMSISVVLVLCGLCCPSDASAPVVHHADENILVMTSSDIRELSDSSKSLISHIQRYKVDTRLLCHFDSQSQKDKDKKITEQLFEQLNFTATEVSGKVSALVNRTIHGPSVMKAKRGLGNFIGNNLSLLFGIAGPNDVETFNKAIISLNSSMSKQTEFNKLIIDGQHIEASIVQKQSDVLKNLSKVADNNFKETYYLQNNDLKLKSLLVVATHGLVWAKKIESSCTDSEVIIADAKNGYLSELALDPVDLQKVVEKISKENQILSPLFSYHDVTQYYLHKLTRVALHDGRLTVGLAVPMIDFRDRNVLRKLSRDEKLSSFHDIFGFTYIAEDKNRRTYLLLEQADIEDSLQIGGSYVMRKRKLEYYVHSFGNIKLGDYVGQWIDIENLVLAAKTPIEAELRCNGSTTTVTLETSVLTIPVHCSLQSKVFYVPEIKQRSVNRQHHFSTMPNHPMLQTFTKVPNHFPGYTYVQAALNETKAEQKVLNEKYENATRVNTEIKERLSTVEIAYSAAGGGLGLMVLIFSVVFTWCLCSNRGNLHCCCLPPQVIP